LRNELNNRPEIVFAIFLCISYLLPFHVYPFAAFYNDWLVIFGVGISILALGRQSFTVVSIPWVTILPLSLALIIAVQALCGMLIVSWDAILPILYCIIAAVCIVLGATLSSSVSCATRVCGTLSRAYMYAGLISVILILIQYFGWGSFLSPLVLNIGSGGIAPIRPSANIGQPNNLALLFCISIASTWYLFQINRLRGNISFILILFFLAGLAITQSRIGWLIIPLSAFLMLHIHKKDNCRQVTGYLTVGLGVAYVFFVITLPHITQLLQGVTISSPMERIGTRANSERLGMIYQALQMSVTHPWFGVGWYQFGPQQLAIALKFPPTAYAQHSHNIFLNFAAELGWVFTIIFFGILVYWIFIINLIKSANKEGWFALLVFLAVFIHSLVEFPLWYAYFLLPVSVLMGVIHQERLGAKKIVFSRAPIIAISLFFILGLILVEKDYRRLTNGFWILEVELKGYQIKELTTERPNITLFPHFYEYFKVLKMEPRSGMTSQEIKMATDVVSRFGYSSALLELALIYALNNKADDAVKILIVISKLHQCSYVKFYNLLGKMANAEPKKYNEIFVRLQKITLPNCGK
jgi:hypothetical protein